MLSVTRFHDISCGHRLVGHEGACALLHGHNYRVFFSCEGEMDRLGRIMDFSVIKSLLCNWLEQYWDHKYLLWEKDPLRDYLNEAAMNDSLKHHGHTMDLIHKSIITVPFNPTAENMAHFLLHVIGPAQLEGTRVILTRVKIEETRKCSATASLGDRYVRS
jgi:6-pyruvoyltetrahydropterin/6-carboxytetrahydropterin synthase